MEGSSKVIKLVGDTTQYLSSIKTIEQANSRMLQHMGAESASVAKVVSSNLAKIGQTQVFNKEGMAENVKVLSELNTVVQMTDGTMGTFKESMANMEDGTTKVSASYKELSKNVKTVSDVQDPLIGKSSQLATNFGSVADTTQKFSSNLKGFGSITRVVGQNVTEMGDGFTKTGIIVKTSNGNFVQLRETVKTLPGGIQQVSRSAKDVSAQFKKTTVDIEKAKKSNQSLGESLAFITKRALITIPAWMILRGAFMGVNRIINSSIKFLIDWEYQMSQIRIVNNATASEMKVLSGTLLGIGKDYGIATDAMGEASKLYSQQGRAMNEIIPLMRTTAKLSLLTGNTMVQSVEDLTAITNAFNISAEKSINIVDSMTATMLCFDPETEVLTKQGWKNYKEISLSDKLFSINLANMNMSYEDCNNVFINKEYTGLMATYNHNINFKVTPNHKFPIGQNNSHFYKKNIYNLREIQDTPKEFSIPSTGNWTGEFCSHYHIPETHRIWMNPRNKKEYTITHPGFTFNTNDLVEFIGWYVSEGSICGTTINISQYESIHRPEVNQIKKLLKRMGIEYRYDGKQFWLKGQLHSLRKWLQDECYVKNTKKDCYSKTVPEFIRGLTSEQIAIFVKAFLKGDGHESANHSDVLYTASTALKDILMELCLKIGKTPSCKKYNNVYRIICSNKKRHILRKQEIKYVSYSGIIWCVETKPNHTIYVRRNGTCYWSGNSHAVTAQDLASAYKQTASTASALGVSFSELTGYITAIKAVTRDSGSKIGLSLRTMFSRITTSSAEAIQKLASVPLYLDRTGKATFTVTPRMRNLGSIISELSLKFKSLGSAQQSQLASLVGGVRRQNQVFALFNNFTEAVEAQTDALFGLGRADNAINILTGTAKIGIDKLKNSWASFVDSVADTSLIEKSLKGVAGLISGIEKLIAPDKAKFKERTNAIAEQNEGYARQMQLAEGVAETLRKTNELEEASLRATPKQLEEINKLLTIYKNKTSDALKLEGIDVDFSQILNVQDFSNALEKIQAQTTKLKLDAQIEQELNNTKSALLSSGQELGNILTTIMNDIWRQESGLDTKVVREFRREILAIGRELRAEAKKGLPFDSTKIQKVRDLLKETTKLTDTQKYGVERLLDTYSLSSEKLINEKDTREEILQRLLETEDVLQEINVIEGQKQKIANVILDDYLKRLQLQGKSNAEILKAEILRRKQLGLDGDEIANLERKLSLERERSKEKRLQNKIGSDSEKLFDISQEFGVDIAKQIGDVLAGEIDFSNFIRRGGEAVDVFKDKFDNVFKQQQMEAFFKGNVVPGLESLRGGFGINIAEQGLRGGIPMYDPATEIRRQRVESEILKTQTPVTQAFQTNVEVNMPIEVNLESNAEEVEQIARNVVSRELPVMGSKLSRALVAAQYNKQTYTA